MSVIERVRRDREDLARVLKNHAGIRRIVEDLYPDTAHFIYELLQNAEDTQASEVAFVLSSDGLLFEHNGHTFDEKDIRGITDIGEGTKAEDDEQIGRFGIGFKAVFPYTDTPRIWSPSHSFSISEMVLPSEIPSYPELGERTRFEFPFNSGKKPRDQAFAEVRDGLEEISDNTLLFLAHIEEIQWRVEGGREGRLLRIPHSDHHIEILREIDRRPTESAHFLRFAEPVHGLERQRAAIAFELEPRDEGAPSEASASFASQFRIAAADRGRVAVYFTAAKETSNLRFHLHAPFIPELSRSSIKETPSNEPLFQQLAGLAARSLFAIRDLGLLDREFLAVLPNSHDEIPAPYTPIRNAIVDAMNQEPLTPKHAGGHAPAARLLQAEAGLKALLDRDDIRFLVDTDDDPRDWAVAATLRNSNVDRFLRDLDVEQWGVEQLVEALNDRCSNRRRLCHSTYTWRQGPDRPFLDWIRRKPAAWHRALYALFHRELEDDLDQFDDICVVRLSNGEYGIGSKCYYPTPETRDDPIHPRVEEETYTGGGTRTERNGARAFLDGIGVREIGEFQQVEAILRQRYTDPASVPTRKTHESDLRRFIALVEKQKSASSLFHDYLIFQRSDGTWSCPAGVYLDAPFLETGLKNYFEPLGDEASKAPLSSSYRTFDMLSGLVSFARTCGAADRLAIARVSCTDNPERAHLHRAPGSVWTQTGIDLDFTIPGIEALFETPSLALSRLVWNTLCNRSQDKNILKATYRNNQSNYPHFADSQLVHQLRDASWIPQQDNEFVRPSEALRDLLPDGFPFDPGWPWLTAIRFGAETEKRAEELRKTREMAEELGFSDETALTDGRRFAELAPETRRRILADHEQPVDLPKTSPSNRERRATAVRDEAGNAPRRTTERRPRSVSVNRDPIKREKSAPYLRDQYTNADGVTICQACKDALPFRLADGSYYLEAVEFLSELERHYHQNYLALCPNHAAMLMYANASKDEMKDRFLALDGNELELTLADRPVTVYFTDTHIEDLRVVIEVDDQD